LLALDEAAPQLAPVRAEFHPTAVARGLPLHLTLLYPFEPRAAFDEAVLERVGRTCGGHPPLSFSLTDVTTFPGGFVCLAPEPDGGVRALMRALWDQFSETPPYAGEIEDPDPHVTVGWSPDGRDDPELFEAVRRRVEPLLPIRCEIASVSLYEEAQPGRWRLRERAPLGGHDGPPSDRS
jgi:2'-5' RNA ligase